MTAQVDDAPGTTRTPTAVGPLAGAGLGAAAAVVSLLPWLVTGARLPLQNLWAVQTLPGDMPVALLPLSQYAVTQVLALLAVGPAVAGLVLRALRRAPQADVRPRAVLGAAGGVLAVHAVVAVQSLVVVGTGLSERTTSQVYLAAVVALVVCGVLIGQVALVLLASETRAAMVLGAVVVALLVGPWLHAVAAPVTGLPRPGLYGLASWGAAWLPPLVVGAAIGWAGVRTLGRVAAAVAALVLLWVVPAVLTAVESVAGYRAAMHYPAELAAYGVQVLQAALAPDRAAPQLLVAVVVAVGVAVVAQRARTSRAAS